MFKLYAKKNQLMVEAKEPLASGSAGAYRAQFRFSEDWAGLKKTAVFRVGDQTWKALPDGDGQCESPSEALSEPGRLMYAGVYGTDGQGTILPTVWAYIGTVLESAAPKGSEDYEQVLELLAGKADRLAYTEDGGLGLYAGETLLSAIPPEVADHRVLTNRDAADQHPVEAITGLRQALDSVPNAPESITNEELEALLQ